VAWLTGFYQNVNKQKCVKCIVFKESDTTPFGKIHPQTRCLKTTGWFDSTPATNRPLAIRAESRILEEFKVGATLNLARVKGVL